MGVPGDSLDPDYEFILALVGGAIFQYADEYILDQIFADTSVAG